VLVLTSAVFLAAQSGRRQSKSKSTVPIAPVEEPSPTPAPKVESKKPNAELVVGIEHGGGFDFVPLYYYGVVLHSCANRLGRAPAVTVSVSEGNVSRAQAISRAKAEKQAHVVWLQLRSDRASADRNIDNVNEVAVDYLVLAPTTAKVVTSGRTYQRRGYRKGGVVIGPPTTGRTPASYVEYMLQEAAKEAAERILSALHLGTRNTLP
ncbi:MAG: hypothetical protein ACRD6N_17945, partial [Pyrinomonadaceae bacterium]